MLRDTIELFRESLRDAWQAWRIFAAIVAFVIGMYITADLENYNLHGLVIWFVVFVAIWLAHFFYRKGK